MKQRPTSPWLTGFLVLIVIALVLGALWMSRPDPPQQLAPEPAAAPVRVRSLAATSRRHQLRVYGQTQPFRRTALAMDQSGLVTWRSPLLEVGSEVGVGFPLLKLDDQRAQLAVQAAQANLNSAQANADWRRAERAVAEQELQNAQQSEPVARREAERQQNLAEAGSGSASAADQAHLVWLGAHGRLDRARATQASVEAAWQAATVQAEAAQVAVRQAELELAKCELKAPFIGEVVAVATEVGSWMAPGMPVCELVDRQTLLVQAPLPNADVAEWLPEYSAWLNLPAYLDQDGQPLKVKAAFHGLSAIARVESRARLLELKFDNQQLGLPGGAFAEVWIDLGERTAIWLQPSDFRLGDHGPEAVVVNNKHADVRALRLGRILVDADGQSWHPVLEGLSVGEVIAVDNLETPRSGDPVTVLP